MDSKKGGTQMAQGIPASLLAQTASDVLQSGPVPFKSPGRSLSGMDATGYIAYCLGRLGIRVNATGSNSLYREIGGTPIPLSDALKKSMVVPGALLFRVENDGREPAKFRGDGRGNATFALICIAPGRAAYPSRSRGKLIETAIEVVSGKANMVVLHPKLDYGALSSPPPKPGPSPTLPHPTQMRVVTPKGRLNLRPRPSKNTSVLARIEPGTQVQVNLILDGWAHITHTSGSALLSGWVMTEFLQEV